jgi:hypothetical protein
MSNRMTMASITAALLVGNGLATAAEPAGVFKAGVASRVITPTEPMWLSGYGNRTHASEGKLQDLYVKALALEDARGGRLLLLTSDLVGFPRAFSQGVVEEVQKRAGLARERIMLTCSHTHCGPLIRGPFVDWFDLPPEQSQRVETYTDQLHKWMVEVMVAAVADLKPAQLSLGKGTARFAVNRREPTPRGIINGYNPQGPVDHDVPVLRVTTPEGRLRAVVFGYACHNTTLSFYQWCGDYAGFAQAYLQEKHPEALALFWIGCGADANPLPRSKVELCQKYGRDLADAVEAVLGGPLKPVRGDVAARYREIVLPLDKLPSREQWAADLLAKERNRRKRAERYLKVLEAGGRIDDQYRHYPVQAWRLGDDLTWVALGGEVVVDYDLRLKKELAGDRTLWVTAYANDVMAYIPSERVLKEGGYEGDTSMLAYGMPTKWASGIENRIISKVHELVKEVTAKESTSGSGPR